MNTLCCRMVTNLLPRIMAVLLVLILCNLPITLDRILMNGMCSRAYYLITVCVGLNCISLNLKICDNYSRDRDNHNYQMVADDMEGIFGMNKVPDTLDAGTLVSIWSNQFEIRVTRPLYQ